MADEIIDEVLTEGTTEGTPTEDTTTGNGYLTKPYLVRNLQTFWSKIKEYIKNQKFVNEDTVKGALLSKAEASALKDLETTVTNKVSQAELTERLAGKVDAEQGKGLSENDFTDVLKTKLDQLTSDVATSSNPGLMSSDDKQKLDSIAREATKVTVDSEWNPNSENPAQSKVISAELAKKADKENLKDSSDLIGNGLSCEGNSDGDIILTLHQNTKHFKIHTESGETIEKFYVSFKGTDGQDVNFNGFGGDNRNITIPNPDGKGNSEEGKTYKFYVECYKTLTNGNYEPFILKITRHSADPTYLIPSIFKN